MKKMFLLGIASVCVVFCLFSMSCSRKRFATGPNDGYASDTQLVPFTKALKQRLEHDGVDIRKIQFYVDQKLVLKSNVGAGKERVQSGVILVNSQPAGEIIIPESTPGVCEKVNGDDLMISFDSPGKGIEFGALYANNTFMIVGTNWHNNGVDITYDGKPYEVECPSCGNIADVKLLVKKNQTYGKDDQSRVVLGRRVN